MKKETRFSVKCERFIKLVIQLLPLLVFVGYMVYPFLCALSDFNLNLSFDDSSVPTFFNDWYVYFYDNGEFESFYDFITVYMVPFNLDTFVGNIINTFNIASPSVPFFVCYYFFYLVWIEIIWLLKNVLMFLPKIGNYFITKWSGY